MTSLEAEVRSQERTIIMPYCVAPPRCAKQCRHLRRALNEAVLQAVANPGWLYVVICYKHHWLSHPVDIEEIGGWDDSNDPTSKAKVFVSGPGYPTGGHGYGTADMRIAQAMANGAQRYDELPPLR